MKLTHNIKNISITASTKINASVDWSYFNKFNSITDGYLPATGEGETMASQLVTAMAKLIYKWYNDGDVYDNNYGLEGWCNDLSSYANWIYNHYPEATHILDRIRGCYLDSQYEDILKALADTLFDPAIIEESATRKCAGSIYTEDGPFSFTEFSEDEEEDDEYYEDDEYDDIYESTSIEGTESLISKFARNVCDALWEDCNIWAEWDKTSEGILISMSDDPDSDTQATFTIPEYELDFDNYDFDDMVDNYVENLQEEFIGSTSSEDIDSATNIPDIQSYYTDDAVSRYIHSLIPEIADLLESEGYDVSFDQDANNLYISIYPSGEDYEDGTYTFPKSALTCKDVKTDASNIVEILMNRAHFEDLYACDSVTSATVLGWYDNDLDDESEWEFVRSKQVTDSDGFTTEYTMYKNIYTDKYIFMFGDSDIYGPDEAYADYECDTEDAAFEWFDNYRGFDEDERSIDDLIDDAGGYSRIKQLVQDTCEMYPGIEDDFEELAECLEGQRDLSYDNWLSVLEYLFEDGEIYSAQSVASDEHEDPFDFVHIDGDYATGKTWEEFIKNVEDTFKFKVDAAYREHPDQFIMLYDGPKCYEAEVTQYSDGSYELVRDNIHSVHIGDGVYSSTTAEPHPREYFGQAQAAQYGDLIVEQLSGKTISKRKDLGDQPGGLVYEANKLGIDMWDLLEALEGMCYEGRAREIDDSTYKVLSCEQILSSTSSHDTIDESKWTSWTDVYTLFEDIIDKYLPDEDKIAEEVDKLYNTYRHNRHMRTAYDKWCESGTGDI